MGKDNETVKKRRKLNTAAPEPPKLPVDVYKRVVEFEEIEASQRPAENDAALYKSICHDIRQIFSDIAELKTGNSDDAKEQINAKRVAASLLIVTLKKLNRLEKVRTKTGREALHKEKQRVDSTHLLLQNLLYEAEYLDKEVTKCLQFKSKDEEIELVPLKDFYKNAPPEVSRPDQTKNDEHQRQLARLEWELLQRRKMAGDCNELVASKVQVCAAIAVTRSRLDALTPHLRDVLKSTKPLQECLALPLDEKREELQSAGLLPRPLYLLYANASAFNDTLAFKSVSVSISGDEDEAKRLQQTNFTENDLEVSNDSDSDQDNNEEQREKKKRHHRTAKISKEERAEAKKREVLKRHPLNVQISIKIKDDTGVNLIFSYMLHLKIVVVKFVVTLPNMVTGISAVDALHGHNVLHDLYPGDSGENSPHPATKYLLTSAGILCDFDQFTTELGRPYIWAQRMCGLDFITTLTGDYKNKNFLVPCPKLSVVSVENVMSILKKRLKARVNLMKELQELESGKISLLKSDSAYPIRLSGSLTQWQSVCWPEYSQAASTSYLVANNLVHPDDMLYRAIITRQSAKLVALVALKSQYPKISPIFSLTLHWNGTHLASTHDDIRDIERVINTGWGTEERTIYSLSSQITKLLTCLDILLETSGSSEFSPDKVMLRPVRGRNRLKPYNFLKQGSGVFIQ